MNTDAARRDKLILSHLGILRIFALWGILDALIILLAKNDRVLEILIYSFIFVVLTFLGLSYPGIIDFII